MSELSIDSSKDGIIIAVGVKYQNEVLTELIKAGALRNIYVQKIYYMNALSEKDDFWAMPAKINNKRKGFFSKYQELESIGKSYKTDKSFEIHNYLIKYEFFLNVLKEKVFTLLELGVLNGSSLNMWGEYFPYAEIIGVDVMPSCKKYEGGNRKVVITDLSYEKNIEQLKDFTPRVIIDDASHLWSHQIKALFILFPSLPSGGIYIMEDLETSFRAYGHLNCDDACISAYEVCSYIAKIVTSDEFLSTENLNKNIENFKNEIESIGSQIEMISFMKGSCIMIKK